MSGTYEAAVFSDPTNTFGAGDLDFMYQVTNNAGSTDSIGRITAINFLGFQTDVGYAIAGSDLGSGFVDGTIAPELVDRVSPGDSIGFSFSAPLTTLIAPGDTSTVLIIETDATNYKPGFANLLDGGATTVSAYGPVAPLTTTPEPRALSVIALGLFGMIVVRRKITQRAKSL
jgi:hypothetical protein